MAEEPDLVIVGGGIATLTILLKLQNNVAMRLKVDRMTEFNNYRLILDELDHTLSHVDDTSYERFANDVVGADRIFVAGKGRSGFVANSLQCV